MHKMEEATTAFPLLSKRQLSFHEVYRPGNPNKALSGCAGAGRAEAGAEDGVGARMVMA